MKLLIFPLIFLIVFTVLGQLGLSSEVAPNYVLLGNVGLDGGWQDSGGRLILYSNGTLAATEAGNVTEHQTILGHMTAHLIYWTNSTGSYQLYAVNGGTTAAASFEGSAMTFDSTTAFGLLGIVSAMIVTGAVIGMKIFGIGEGEESLSLIIKGTFLLFIWGVFSLLSMDLIVAIPIFGVVFYFFLTFLYTMGIINQVGHPGED